MNYKEYCEDLYTSWRTDPIEFSAFDSYFNMFSLPEPYFPLSKGEGEGNPLVVLNNNPGGILPFQHHSEILKKFTDKKTYAEVARFLMDEYNEPKKINSAAKARNKKILAIAEVLGYDSVENVETFFLHSQHFNKSRFLNEYKGNKKTKKYTELLTSYLKNRPVIIVAAVSSKESLSIDNIKKSFWLRYQAEIAGLKLENAKLKTITKKGAKFTSGIIWEKNKILICTMGSNSIPCDAINNIRNISSCFLDK